MPGQQQRVDQFPRILSKSVRARVFTQRIRLTLNIARPEFVSISIVFDHKCLMSSATLIIKNEISKARFELLRHKTFPQLL